MSPIRSAGRARAEGGHAAQRRTRRWLPRAALLIAVALLTTGCQTNSAWTNFGLRKPATTQAQLILTLWKGSWVAAICVGIVVWGLILWAVLFHRKRGNTIPHQVRYNLPIEIMYTVIPFIMVGVLFYFTARDENTIDKLSSSCSLPHCVVVDVTGFQWSWEFQYPQFPVHNSVDGVSDFGAMWNGQLGASSNESRLPLLEVPYAKNGSVTVRFNLRSLDVIHSFWVIPFDFKRDVIPGHPNHFQVNPIGPAPADESIGRCSELCGLYHSRMLFRIKIVPLAQFMAWAKSQQALQNAAGGAS